MTVKFIVGHWSGGLSYPNKLDKNSYQLLIDAEGAVHRGLAQGCTCSTGGMNSITYNIACCGGLSTSRLTPIQVEKFFKTCAEKIKVYGLTANDFYTHAEIGEMCRGYRLKQQNQPYDKKHKIITDLLPYNEWLYQNIGKIDLTILPAISGNAFETGNFIRNKIKWYLSKIN